MTLTIKCVVLTNSNCLSITLGLGNICYRVRAVSTDRDCFHYTYWIFLTPLKLLMCENIDKFKLEVWNLKVLNLKVSSLFELLLLARGCLSLTQESVYVQYVQHLQWSFKCWVVFLFSFVFSFCFVVCLLLLLLLLLFLNAVFVRAGGVSMKEYLSFVFGECYCHHYFPV